LSSVAGSTDERGAVNTFFYNWLHASQIIREEGHDADMEQMLAILEADGGPHPLALRTQRARLRAALGQNGSLSTEEIEKAYTEALDMVRDWGSALFEAHASADFGTWLIRQGRTEEGTALVATAREFYTRVGARRWLDALDRLP
jgi:hypothetical protein